MVTRTKTILQQIAAELLLLCVTILWISDTKWLSLPWSYTGKTKAVISIQPRFNTYYTWENNSFFICLSLNKFWKSEKFPLPIKINLVPRVSFVVFVCFLIFKKVERERICIKMSEELSWARFFLIENALTLEKFNQAWGPFRKYVHIKPNDSVTNRCPFVFTDERTTVDHFA